MNAALTRYDQRGLIPAISAPQALEQWVQHNFIPAAEAETNRTALCQVQREDQKRYAADVRTALVEYKKQYSPWARLALFVRRGFKGYRPELAPLTASPETQLLEQVVALQEVAIKGHELFEALPVVVRKMKQDYEQPAARQGELELKISDIKRNLQDLPARQQEYALLLQHLEKYAALSEPEKETLSAELQTKTGIGMLPPLENAAVRSLVQQKLNRGYKELNKNSLSSLLEVLDIEYASVQRQQRIIESQESQLEQGWKPALIQLSRLKEQYDMLSRFTSGARLLIGMNELRKDTAEMVARSEEIMAAAAAHINNTRIDAEAYEESFAVPSAHARILDTDESIIIDVEEDVDIEEEPFLAERK
ncbi:MAG: hypothetical protein AABW48_02990 [Nanoarchaeota archaeon]